MNICMLKFAESSCLGFRKKTCRDASTGQTMMICKHGLFDAKGEGHLKVSDKVSLSHKACKKRLQKVTLKASAS